jgi:hypothetical protein
MRFFVLIPTTGGPIVLKSLKPRAGLPASTAFAEGDFRPLPWSSDYARLCASALAPVIPGLVPHELRTSGSFDAGRSWEVPVTLAHLLVARGHEIVSDLDSADALVWATGAVDLDIIPIAGDYAVADKLALSKPLFEQAKGKKTLFIAPAAPGAGLTESWMMDAGLKPADPQSLVTQLDRFLYQAVPEKSEPKAPVALLPQKGKALFGLVAGLLVLLAAVGAYGFWRNGQPPTDPSPVPIEKPVEKKDEAKPVIKAVEPQKPPEKPVVLLFELRADNAAGCKKLVFGTGSAKRLPVAAKDSIFAQSKQDGTLCGVALKPEKTGAVLKISGDLTAASLPPVSEKDGTMVYLFKAKPLQNIVYRVQVEGDALSFRHDVSQ